MKGLVHGPVWLSPGVSVPSWPDLHTLLRLLSCPRGQGAARAVQGVAGPPISTASALRGLAVPVAVCRGRLCTAATRGSGLFNACCLSSSEGKEPSANSSRSPAVHKVPCDVLGRGRFARRSLLPVSLGHGLGGRARSLECFQPWGHTQGSSALCTSYPRRREDHQAAECL